jgi:hypothetical protein
MCPNIFNLEMCAYISFAHLPSYILSKIYTQNNVFNIKILISNYHFSNKKGGYSEILSKRHATPTLEILR